jgi:hypothetical protein
MPTLYQNIKSLAIANVDNPVVELCDVRSTASKMRRKVSLPGRKKLEKFGFKERLKMLLKFM